VVWAARVVVPRPLKVSGVGPTPFHCRSHLRDHAPSWKCASLGNVPCSKFTKMNETVAAVRLPPKIQAARRSIDDGSSS
jgi:hypothetical protein